MAAKMAVRCAVLLCLCAAGESFTVESLQSLKFSKLKRLALVEGLTEAQVDAALEAPKPKLALIKLLEPLAEGGGWAAPATAAEPPAPPPSKPPPPPPPRPTRVRAKQPPPPPPPPPTPTRAPAKDIKFCECDWSIGTWTQPQSIVNLEGVDMTQDGYELCELDKNSGPDSGCVFALGGFPRNVRDWMGNTRHCWMISGRGTVLQRELVGEYDERARCSPPEGAAPIDRVAMFEGIFAGLDAPGDAVAAAIMSDFELLEQALRDAGYNRESILAIGQRPYTNPSFVDLFTIGRPTGTGILHDLVRFFTVAHPLERTQLEVAIPTRCIERLISLGAIVQVSMKSITRSMKSISSWAILD